MSMRYRTALHPLITKDPVDGSELIVTRLEGAQSGVVIEGAFSLGWIGRLTPEQLEFVGLLAKHRGNLQGVAADMQVAYNTARNRMDEVVAALNATGVPTPPTPRMDVLDRLEAGQISFDEATRLLNG